MSLTRSWSARSLLLSSDFTSGTASFSSLRPKKSNPKPTNTSPKFFIFGLLAKIIGRPTPIMGKASLDRLNLPTVAMIQPVSVVPRFAPIMTPIDSIKVSS